MMWPFGRRSDSIIAVVDIRSSSVCAGYARLTKDALPHIVEAIEFPLDPNATEPQDEMLPRVLAHTLDALIKKGSPKLQKLYGRSSVDRILCSVSSPWHTHTVALRQRSEERPFTVTPHVIESLIHSDEEGGAQRDITARTVLSTLLNGYEVSDPYHKKATQVQVVTLVSSIEPAVHAAIRSALASAFHTKNISTTAFTSEFFLWYKRFFPHQQNYLLLDMSGTTMDSICVKHGFLVTSRSHAIGAHDAVKPFRKLVVSSGQIAKDDVLEKEGAQMLVPFTQKLRDAVAQIAQDEPLPSLVLYHCPEEISAIVHDALSDKALYQLWLTQDPVTTHELTSELYKHAVTAEEGLQAPLPILMLAACSPDSV